MMTADKKYMAIVWEDRGEKPMIIHIYLPERYDSLSAEIKKEFPILKRKTQKKFPTTITEKIAELYAGKDVGFDLSCLDLSELTEFSAKVLKQTFKIPRGKVATYSGLAARIGHPGAARAVGTALANNPFPLVIPCHRVVRSDGALGGFGGGLKMKKELLTKEEVIFQDGEKVSEACIFWKS